MKIIKDGKLIAELPDKPRNFDSGCKDGQIALTIGDTETKIARYKSYLAGAEEFILPKEE